MVKYKNIRFYNFAVFPVGSYVVHFDESKVRVDLMEGEDFIPTLMQEVDYQPTTRLSMLRRYLVRRIGYPIRGKYNDFIYLIKRAIKRLRMLIK